MIMGQDPHDIEALWGRVYESMNVRGHYQGFMIAAMAALDIALWDLAGKLLGVPFSSLLGGRRRDELDAYVTGLGEDAQHYLEEGHSGVKVGLVTDVDDLGKFGLDIDQVDPSGVMVDHHWLMDSAHDAIRLGRELERIGVGFVEAPLTPEDIDGTARVT